MHEQRPAIDPAETEPGGVTGDVPAPATGRHRQHRRPARQRAMKVLYGDDEWSVVAQAAGYAGLRPSSFVANAALAAADQVVHHEALSEQGRGRRGCAVSATPTADRELLGELIQARLALRRFAVNVNQAVAALNSGADAPVWLPRAAAGAARAVARVDEVTAQVSRQLR